MKKHSVQNTSRIKNLIIALLVVIVFGLLLRHNKSAQETATPQEPVPAAPTEATSISVSKEDIKEENWTGSKPIISGKSEIVLAARAWVDQDIADFRAQADADVPAMRAQFGADAPPAHYTLDIIAKYAKAKKTHSLILVRDAYTGGANDNESYKVFTASLSTGQVLALSDIIASDKQAAFVSFMKTKLTNWRPPGVTTSVVFPESIDELTFASFSDWSFDNSNLIIYFDKYDIGPGVLGAVVFPIPLDKVGSYLVATYK